MMMRAILVILATVALLAAAIGTPALAAPREHKTASTPGFLIADGGTGFAMSLKPGANPVIAGTGLYAYPPTQAWLFEQNVDGGKCDHGRVDSTCPWTGAAANLDKRYAGHPIYSYALVFDTRLCAAAIVDDSTDVNAAPDIMVLAPCTTGFRSVRDVDWVPEDNAGAASGAVLSVRMTQIAGGRRVMCDNGEDNVMTATPTGDCSNGHQDWEWTQDSPSSR